MPPARGRTARITAKQVAAHAGVSPTTVSLVLSGAAGVSIGAATRERVRRAAAELGYAPSAAARTLHTGRSDSVGLAIHRTELLCVDAFIPQLLYGLEQVARAHGLHVRIEGMEALAGPDPYAELFRAGHIDGLVLLDPRAHEPGLAALVEAGYPIVSIGNLPGSDPNRVVGDNALGMRTLTEHLLRLGHSRIAHLTLAPTAAQEGDQRLAGYRDALRAAGIPPNPALVVEAGYSAASGAAAMAQLLARGAPVSAVTCGNDTVAIGAIATLVAAGYRVPEDVAVVGFDDIPTAAYQNPPLTTMRTDPVTSGRVAMRMLTELLRGSAPPERVVVLPSALVVRRSCGATRG